MRIIFVKHTTTDWNLKKKVQGQSIKAPGLNEQGTREAIHLADEIAGTNEYIARVISSDLRRAKEAGKIIARRLGVPFSTDQRLRECSFGELEGLTIDEIKKRFGDLAAGQLRNASSNYDFSQWDGENKEQVLSRHNVFLRSLLAGAINGTIVIVGHDIGLDTLLLHLGFSSRLRPGEFQIMDID